MAIIKIGQQGDFDEFSYPMPFGKYKGKSLRWIADEDPLYVDWLVGCDNLRPPLRELVFRLADEYSDEIESALERREDWDD